MNTQEEIQREAFRIWQLRKRLEEPDADNAIANWKRAEEILTNRGMRNSYHRRASEKGNEL